MGRVWARHSIRLSRQTQDLLTDSGVALSIAVDVALPVYNGERFLARTLKALLDQTHENLKIHVLDNASTDSTRDIVLKVAANDERVVYHRNDRNLGAIENFNRALAFTQAPFVMWASDHDSWAPNYIETCLTVMREDPTVALCYTGARWIDEYNADFAPVRSITDTRGLPALSRLNVTLWGFGDYSYAVYGLHRRSALTCLRNWPHVYPDTVAPDHLLLGELALVGACAYVPAQLFYLRRMSDHGDFDAYTTKLNKSSRSRLQGLLLYVKLLLALSRLGRGHFRNPLHSAVAAGSGFTVGLTNYRHLGAMLWAQSGRESTHASS